MSHFISSEKQQELENEKQQLREKKIPELAKRIDEARQLGDLSENAEYHAAREEMAWAQSRVKEIEHILEDVQIIHKATGGAVGLGSIITVSVNGKERELTIVGAQEASPMEGKISNESPLGAAFMGKKKGDVVEVVVPAGVQEYTIIAIK